MVAVRDRLDEFGDETTVVLVTFTERSDLARYAAGHQLPFPVVTDPERTAYRAYGLGRGSVARVWGWRALRRYVAILLEDGFAGLRRPTEDTLQLGGDFVIDPAGTLVYGYWGEGPDDRPTVAALLAAARSASATA